MESKTAVQSPNKMCLSATYKGQKYIKARLAPREFQQYNEGEEMTNIIEPGLEQMQSAWRPAMIGKNQCEHGQLARSCNICELEKENASLKARLKPVEDCYEWFSTCANDHRTIEELWAAIVKANLTWRGYEQTDGRGIKEMY